LKNFSVVLWQNFQAFAVTCCTVALPKRLNPGGQGGVRGGGINGGGNGSIELQSPNGMPARQICLGTASTSSMNKCLIKSDPNKSAKELDGEEFELNEFQKCTEKIQKVMRNRPQ